MQIKAPSIRSPTRSANTWFTPFSRESGVTMLGGCVLSLGRLEPALVSSATFDSVPTTQTSGTTVEHAIQSRRVGRVAYKFCSIRGVHAQGVREAVRWNALVKRSTKRWKTCEPAIRSAPSSRWDSRYGAMTFAETLWLLSGAVLGSAVACAMPFGLTLIARLLRPHTESVERPVPLRRPV